MKAKVKNYFQRFSASLIIPIRILPIIGLLLALSNIFTHPILMDWLPVLEDSLYTQFFSILAQAMLTVLEHLGLIFAVGITAGLAEKEKAEAGFISLLSYFIFIFVMNRFMAINDMLVDSTNLMGTGQTMQFGLQVLDMGIVIGILLGIITAIFYNKWREIKLPQPFQIYGGTRFVSLVLIPIVGLLAVAFSSIGPWIQNGIFTLAQSIDYTGNFGLFIYGALERLSIPSGLQNLVYTPFLYTSLGGVEEVGGIVYEGARNIYFAEMVDPSVQVLSENVLWDARGISKMFGLVGASLAMYHTAKPENKERTRKLLIPAVLTSFFAGITEPIEFSFLFVAPVLFVIHSILSGLSLVVLNLFNIRAIGPNGFVDFFIYNVPLGIEKTGWPMYIAVGLLFFVLYYMIFRFLITRFNLNTVGREDDPKNTKMYTKEDYQAKKEGKSQEITTAQIIVDALGGADNINTLTNCYSRLRLTVDDPTKVDEATLKNQTGASGVMITDQNVHVVYGMQVNKIRQNVDKHLGRDSNEE